MKLGDLQKNLGCSLEEVIRLVEENLHEEPYTKEEIGRELGTSVSHLDEVSFTPNTRNIQSFKLRQRALHVFKGKPQICAMRWLKLVFEAMIDMNYT